MRMEPARRRNLQRAVRLVKRTVRALSSTFPDTDHSSLLEPRFLTIGTSRRSRILVVAHSEGLDTVRIISAKPATRQERTFYEEG
jgi:uncharacterized DUF497 family protein